MSEGMNHTQASGYSARVTDRKMVDRASAVQSWLSSPMAAITVPRKVRAEIDSLLTRLAELLIPDEPVLDRPPVEHLTERPPVGTTVRLLSDGWYLRDYHSASAGSVGKIVAHSDLNRDDRGVLVDWGRGRSARCSLSELALVV